MECLWEHQQYDLVGLTEGSIQSIILNVWSPGVLWSSILSLLGPSNMLRTVLRYFINTSCRQHRLLQEPKGLHYDFPIGANQYLYNATSFPNTNMTNTVRSYGPSVKAFSTMVWTYCYRDLSCSGSLSRLAASSHVT